MIPFRVAKLPNCREAKKYRKSMISGTRWHACPGSNRGPRAYGYQILEVCRAQADARITPEKQGFSMLCGQNCVEPIKPFWGGVFSSFLLIISREGFFVLMEKSILYKQMGGLKQTKTKDKSNYIPGMRKISSNVLFLRKAI